MKKLLVVSAIAALGLNTVALAGGLPEEMPMAPAAVATSDAGIYLGIEGGYGLTNWKYMDGYNNTYTPVEQSCVLDATGKFVISNDNGFVGRAFLGYSMNRYFALEFGYTYFFNKAKFSNPAGVEFTNAKTQAFDLMGKGSLPVVENFDLYAKLGVSYLMTRWDNSYYPNQNNFNVAYGAGADYYITPNIIANVEWLRFNGHEKVVPMMDYQPHTDIFMIGLRYKFDL